MPPKQQRTQQRANSMIDQLRARTLAPVPDIAPVPAAPATEPEATPAPAAAAMPAEQPKQPRQPRQQRQRPAARPDADKPETFPHRITQTMSYTQADQLDTIRVEENRKLRNAGHEQVYTVTGLIRAAVDVCLSDPKLTARMIKAASEPRLSGRGGIGTRR